MSPGVSTAPNGQSGAENAAHQGASAGTQSTRSPRQSALDRVLHELESIGPVKRSGDSYSARCPAHDDNNPSLGVKGIEGQALLKCYAGCETPSVVAALGLTMADLFDNRKGAEYQYSGGRVVHRSPDKKFRQSGDTSDSSLYRADRLPAAVAAGTTVFVVEGEKDVHALESIGAVATCSPMGAGKFRRCDQTPLTGAVVVIVADDDAPGRKHAADVADALKGTAKCIATVLPAAGKDAADHVTAGHGLDDFRPWNIPAADHARNPGGQLSDLLTPGGSFILDAPDHVPAIWGDGSVVLWAEGEALIIAGPPGVGKTTLVGQVVSARLGIGGPVLGLPVRRTARRVLYLAMDRPKQIARSLRRTLGRANRGTLDAWLIVWQGPPPADLAKCPEKLLELARAAGADTVVIDSLKDAAIGLTEDEVGAGYNRARQLCLANGVEVIELHHLVKRGANGTKPNTLADVYGSTWITAGAGSVLLLWGEPGDPIVEAVHLKQPAEPFGPCKLIHDHDTGTTTLFEPTDLVAVARAAGPGGITAKAAAVVLFNVEKPTASHVEKARRRMSKLAQQGVLTERPGDDRTATPTAWFTPSQTLTRTLTQDHLATTLTEPSRPSRENAYSQVSDPHANPHDPHADPPSRLPPPLYRGGKSGHGENDHENICQACLAPADPDDPLGLCGTDDQNHRDALRILGPVAS